MENKQEQLNTLHKLIALMSKENKLPMDLQLVFQDLEDYIQRNS